MARRLLAAAIATAGLLAGASQASALEPLSAPAVPSVVGGTAIRSASGESLALVLDERPHGEVIECSGTLVAPRLVLTAAHCAAATPGSAAAAASGFRVMTGSPSRSGATARWTRVERVLIFPGYRESGYAADAALVELARRSAARPVRLPTSAEAQALTAPGERATLAGWGETQFDESFATGRALEAATTIQPGGLCAADAAADLGLPYAPAAELCALATPADLVGACHGDSGGPLFAGPAGAPVEIGVITHGDGRCSTAVPTYFTRVEPLEPWIRAWIARAAGRVRRIYRLRAAGLALRLDLSGSRLATVRLAATLRCPDGRPLQIDGTAAPRGRSARLVDSRLRATLRLTGGAAPRARISLALRVEPDDVTATARVVSGRGDCEAAATMSGT